MGNVISSRNRTEAILARIAERPLDAESGGKVRYRPDGTQLPMIAVPVSGYKNNVSIDRRYGFIRGSAVPAASAADGRQLRRRSQRNETWLAARLFTSQIRRRNRRASRCPGTSLGAMRKSSIRATVEHVFAHQKNRFGLFVRTIGLARAEAKLTLANIAYNFDRLIFHERRRATG